MLGEMACLSREKRNVWRSTVLELPSAKGPDRAAQGCVRAEIVTELGVCRNAPSACSLLIIMHMCRNTRVCGYSWATLGGPFPITRSDSNIRRRRHTIDKAYFAAANCCHEQQNMDMPRLRHRADSVLLSFLSPMPLRECVRGR